MISLPMSYATQNEYSAISIDLINQDPDPAQAGDIVDIRLGIENIGGDAVNNLMVELIPEYPFTLVQKDTALQNIGTINSYQGYYDSDLQIIKYILMIDRNTPKGDYELTVKYYEDGSDSVMFKSISIEINNAQNAEIIHIDKTSLVPGKQDSLKFTINNLGNSPLSDLRFSWENDDKIILPVGSDNSRYIKYIEIGDSAELEYEVIADTNAVAGLYQLNLHLTYDSQTSDQDDTISTIAGIYVGGETDFDVTFSENTNGQLSFSIANIGNNPANSIALMIPEQNSWTVSGSNSFMIGNLNKGDYTIASFNLQKSTTSTDTPIPGTMRNKDRTITFNTTKIPQTTMNTTTDILYMNIAYTDTMGERNIIQKSIKIKDTNLVSTDMKIGILGSKLNTESNPLSQYGTYIIAIGLLIILIVINQRYKKQKLQNPNLKFKDYIKKDKK